MLTRELTLNQQFVNALRACLRLQPLYVQAGLNAVEDNEGHGYFAPEVKCRLAVPDCSRCGGAGYYLGANRDEVCPCTGIGPHKSRRNMRGMQHAPTG